MSRNAVADRARREARTGEIIQCARELFAERGYGVSLEVVARRLGLSKAALYGYFRSKEDLYAAALADGMERLQRAVESERESRQPAAVRLGSVVERICLFAFEHRAIFELVHQARGGPQLARRWRNRRRIRFDIVSDLLRDGMARGEFVPCDVELAAAWVLVGAMAAPKFYAGSLAPREAASQLAAGMVASVALPSRRRRK